MIYNLEKKEIVNLGNFSGEIECSFGAIWLTYMNTEIVLENSSVELKKAKGVIIQSLGKSKVLIN